MISRWSLLTRLIIWYTVSFVLLTLVSNLFLYFILVKTEEADRNSILSDRLNAVSALLKSPARGKEELVHRVINEWPMRGGEKVYLKIESASHEVIQSRDFPAELEKSLGDLDEKLSGVKLQLEGRENKSYLTRFEVSDNSVGMTNPVKIFAVIGADQAQSFLDQYKRIALLVLFVSAIVSCLIGFLIARAGFLPLLTMTKEVGNIRLGTLHERLNLNGLPIELHKLAITFNQTLDSLEEAFTRLTRFSSDIAHELRTPLTNILGEIEVALSKPRTNLEYTEILSSNLEDCNRLKQIIESLLFLARSENLKSDIRTDRLDVDFEISSIVEFFGPAAAEAEVELNFYAGELQKHFISGEKILFQRVIGNILANAIHYTPKNGRIDINVERRDDAFIKIRIVDSGIGIAPEHLGKIFDRFYRVDSNRNWATGGVGLGLAIVKSIVDLHKGKIEILSSFGTGTSVNISWPNENS